LLFPTASKILKSIKCASAFSRNFCRPARPELGETSNLRVQHQALAAKKNRAIGPVQFTDR